MVPPGDPQLMHAYLVGRSPRRGRFVAYVYPSTESFQRVDITGEMHVTPAPPGVKPTDLEIRHMQRLGAALAAAGLPHVELPPGEPVTEPATDEQWAQLAQRIFRGRALATMDSGLKIPVGGKVTLTRIEVGKTCQRGVHTFTDDDFTAMVAGTLHPDAQLAACQCGSGRRFLDCHLPPAGAPCPCMSGKRFGECCRAETPRRPRPPPPRPVATRRARAARGRSTRSAARWWRSSGTGCPQLDGHPGIPTRSDPQRRGIVVGRGSGTPSQGAEPKVRPQAPAGARMDGDHRRQASGQDGEGGPATHHAPAAQGPGLSEAAHTGHTETGRAQVALTWRRRNATNG